ncbi:hypothetical protein [Mycolicibacterium llatzerense]|uniref:hypothetical protein n=1 Tax=Mycolicibacterium llatzerense TaxID=280871 RepID=UPI0008DD47AB|nr:hypothetical protein [Mycolicibacterium llatzerense]
MALRSLKAWFRSQFVESQRRRNEDLEQWWQMPGDATRTESPSLQLVVDLYVPATFSDWHEKVAESRVKQYDRLRPHVTRAVLLIMVSAGLWVLRAPWWGWMLLLPAGFQVLLEIYLHRYVPDSAPEPRWRIVGWMSRIVGRHFQSMLLNVTGILGTIACPLNVIAVCFAPAGDGAGWVKVAAFGAAIFYLNSGLASAFLDPPNYTEISVMPPAMHWIRPYAPLVSFLIVTGLVAASVVTGHWVPAMVPIGYLCALLTLLLGSTIRNHDRVVAAAAPVARDAVKEAREALGGIVHDDLGPAKAAAESASEVAGVDYEHAVELRALAAYLTNFSTRIGIYSSQRMELSYLVKKLVGPYGISPRAVTYNIAWDSSAMRKEDHKIAIRMTTALVPNTCQSLQLEQFQHVPKTFALEGHTTGEDRDLQYHLAVRDHLPLIEPKDDQDWCGDGTLAALRSWLRDKFGGDLTQEDVGDGTKRIIASWSDRAHATGYGDPFGEESGEDLPHRR